MRHTKLSACRLAPRVLTCHSIHALSFCTLPRGEGEDLTLYRRLHRASLSLSSTLTCTSTRVTISSAAGKKRSPYRTAVSTYDVSQLINGQTQQCSRRTLKFAHSKNQKAIDALKVAMKALLLRSGSVAAASPVFHASAGVALSRHDSLSGVFPGERTAAGSPRITLHLEVNRRTGGIRRALSESDVFRSVGTFSGARSMSFPSRLPEEAHVDSEDKPACSTLDMNFDEMWKRSGILVDDVGLCSGGGSGKGSDSGAYRGSGGGFGGSRRKIGEYYLEMLKLNPGDPLLLRNYGKYLHEVSARFSLSIDLSFPFPIESELQFMDHGWMMVVWSNYVDQVERDFARAEEYYGRAILASPGDGEVLSLYGKLIWETQRDGRRAQSYFDRAVRASSEDW